MADEEASASGRIPGLIQDVVTQLQGMAARLEDLTGYKLPPVPGGMPGGRALPLPGALSSEQLSMLAASVAAQRQSIQAIRAQLGALDEQLAVLERILGPLAEWSKAWAGPSRSGARRSSARSGKPGLRPPPGLPVGRNPDVALVRSRRAGSRGRQRARGPDRQPRLPRAPGPVLVGRARGESRSRA